MDRIEKVRELLGTEIRLIVCAVGANSPNLLAEQTIDKAFLECERIQNKFSRFDEKSELSLLNNKPGKWVKVSQEFYELLKFAQYLNECSEGAFDITVKGILDSWGYDSQYSFKESFGGKLGKVVFGKDFKVKITAPIDLGAIGKGYAVDKMIEHLKDFDNFCINAGGDLYAKGREVDGMPWKVVFEHPLRDDEAIGFVHVDDLALASSNPSRRRWNDKHHLVDPFKKATANQMLAVYTQAKSLMVADGFSTTLFVMGYEKAKALLKDLPVEAMLIGPSGQISLSPGFKGELFRALIA